MILFNAVVSIKKKLEVGLKVNANEALAIFCAYVIEELRDHKSQDEIENAVNGIISSIGVREMNFEAIVDDFPARRLKFIEPMKICNCIMT